MRERNDEISRSVLSEQKKYIDVQNQILLLKTEIGMNIQEQFRSYNKDLIDFKTINRNYEFQITDLQDQLTRMNRRQEDDKFMYNLLKESYDQQSTELKILKFEVVRQQSYEHD